MRLPCQGSAPFPKQKRHRPGLPCCCSLSALLLFLHSTPLFPPAGSVAAPTLTPITILSFPNCALISNPSSIAQKPCQHFILTSLTSTAQPVLGSVREGKEISQCLVIYYTLPSSSAPFPTKGKVKVQHQPHFRPRLGSSGGNHYHVS